MIKMYICFHVKHPLFFARFNKTRNVSTDFAKLLKYPIP